MPEWWMATDQEVREVTNLMHFAESMAIGRGWPIAVTKELICKPPQFCRLVDILEIVRSSPKTDDDHIGYSLLSSAK